MTTAPRVLDAEPVTSLDAYVAAGGGLGLRTAVEAGPRATLAVVEASGLRGRGGAGFPTATKWESVLANLTEDTTATVVVNAAEGEPGSFKDRAIIRANPYRVIEGALIAAATIGADDVVLAAKESFDREVSLLRGAAAEITSAQWLEGVTIDVVAGPSEYLYGEETALLEVIDGREPFPRIAPPWRRGVDEDSALSAAADFAGPTDETAGPPTLVNNVETVANLPGVLASGADWFRELGTIESPGTIVCTITGRTARHGVAEFAMGTPLREVIEHIGGAPLTGEITAVMSGVSNPLMPPDQLDTPMSYEAMAAVGTGLGTGGFLVFDEGVDPVAVAHGVSRFLAVESCGQCTPCKQDGLAVAQALGRLCANQADGDEITRITERLDTITQGARCFLATQHQQIVGSALSLFPESFAGHNVAGLAACEPYLITAIVDIPDGEWAVLDTDHATKQPDWSHDPEGSGESPADRFDQTGGESRV